MTHSIITNCPACKAALPKPEATSGDYSAFNCEKHGEFYVSGTVLAMLRNGNKDVADLLPKLVEDRAGKGIDGMITSYTFPDK